MHNGLEIFVLMSVRFRGRVKGECGNHTNQSKKLQAITLFYMLMVDRYEVISFRKVKYQHWECFRDSLQR